MMLPDVNVMIAAFRIDHVHHTQCRQWLDFTLGSVKRLGISPLALAAVVRITTNTRAFAAPSSPGEATGFGDDLFANRNVVAILPGASQWRLFAQLCISLDIRGQLVTDAWFAALAIEQECEWVTLDRDFARFPGLKWRVP